MQELGAEKVFVDKASGKNVNRPQLNEMLAFARQGDIARHSGSCCQQRMAVTKQIVGLKTACRNMGILG